MQNTIRNSIKLSGVTLHSGEISNVTLLPAAPNTGIIFRRSDLGVAFNETLITAKYDKVTESKLCTKIINDYGHSISTIEHIMSAFHGMNIHNIVIEVDCDELPILDGSSIEYVNSIEKVGIKKLNANRKLLKIKRPTLFTINDSFIKALPSNNFTIDYTIVYNHSLIQEQSYCYQSGDYYKYKNLISNCRTFGFKDEVEFLKQRGLIAGGSLNNAIVLDENGILNKEQLRQEKEFVKHKILDFLGDIYLLGYPIIGSFEIYKGGHRLTHELMNSIMSDESNYSIVEEESIDQKRYLNTYNSKRISAII